MASQSKESKEDEDFRTTIPSCENLIHDQKPRTKTRSVFEILMFYQSRMHRLRTEKKLNSLSKSRNIFSSKCEMKSAQSIMNKARMKLFLCSSTNVQVQDKVNSASSSSSCNLAKDYYSKDIELSVSLLDAAEKVSIHEFDQAEKLLSQCLISASRGENPIQRVVFSFAEALLERIDKQRKRVDLERKIGDIEEFMMIYTPAILACELKLPFTQITHFIGMQAVLDNVGSARKIHFIDFGIKSGSHCIILMQGLASLKDRELLDSIKITAVGTSMNRLEKTGKSLSSFGESLGLPFKFRVVVSEMQDLEKDFFDMEEDEVVTVFTGLRLGCMLAIPNDIEKFTRFVKGLNPCVMVAIEVEADTNTEIFMDRFHETITLACAMSDCLEECLNGELVVYRKIVEEFYFGPANRNIVAEEGEERRLRHAKIRFWRDYFLGFGIVEKELSELSLYQAKLMLGRSACWSSCSLDLDGECMIVKWKGTPIQSLSCWKFQH